MAITKKQVAEPEARKPDFVARCKQSPQSDFWITVGAAWSFKDGSGYSVKLHSTPTNWDGDFILLKPKDD